MKKKGFTLIELLAVIVILAIIALILTPMIQDLILNVRKSAFERSIDGILAAAEYYSIENPGSGNITFECDGVSCGDSNGHRLTFKGEVPISGIITISDSGVIAENLCNSSFCGSGSRESLSIDVGGGSTSTCDKYYSLVVAGTTWEYDFLTNNDVQTIYNFDYTGGEQKFIVPTTGTYVVETWGAEGGSASSSYRGGYGGYSKGIVKLSKGMVLYVNVGGAGIENLDLYGTQVSGGYNGGGDQNVRYTGKSDAIQYGGSGGGATHIATVSGELSALESYKGNLSSDGKYYISNQILIVAGGGGGALVLENGFNGWYSHSIGGSAAGFKDSIHEFDDSNFAASYECTAATQTSVGYCTESGSPMSSSSFGKGADGVAGAGGGFFGGHTPANLRSGGGVGYIANPSLSDKAMYCYDCEESTEANIYTISTTGDNKDSSSCPNGYASSPTTNCAKSGNGYARITLLNADTKCNPSSINSQGFIVPNTGNYKLEVWGAQGASRNATGGYGGYSTGTLVLNKGNSLYITVGGTSTTNVGGYNGGGNGSESTPYQNLGGGGGATHIATSDLGELKNYSNNRDNIVMVAGGGGGTYHYIPNTFTADGGHAGGYIGNNGNVSTMSCISQPDTAATGGSQEHAGFGNNDVETYAGSFGLGGSADEGCGAGGGGGYFGGGATYNVGCSAESGAGGSGYIGYNGLTNAKMFCYNCTEDKANASTYTESTTCTELNPTSECAKQGNGYARIIYLGN